MALQTQCPHCVPEQRPAAQKVRAEYLRDLVGIGVEAALSAEHADAQNYEIHLFESVKRAGDCVGMGSDPVGVQTVEFGGGATGRLELVDHCRHSSVVASEQQRLNLSLLGDAVHDRDADFGATTEHQDPQPSRRVHAHRSSRVPIALRSVSRGSGMWPGHPSPACDSPFSYQDRS